MADILETLRNALLLTLVLILLYVLYKRLLRVLGKDPNRRDYASLNDQSGRVEDGKLVIGFSLPLEGKVKVELWTNNECVALLFDEHLEQGSHHLKLELPQLDPQQRYAFRFFSDGQDTRRFLI